eukprot:PhM_4_TR4112/c0_g1_i1/m.87418
MQYTLHRSGRGASKGGSEPNIQLQLATMDATTRASIVEGTDSQLVHRASSDGSGGGAAGGSVSFAPDREDQLRKRLSTVTPTTLNSNSKQQHAQNKNDSQRPNSIIRSSSSCLRRTSAASGGSVIASRATVRSVSSQSGAAAARLGSQRQSILLGQISAMGTPRGGIGGASSCASTTNRGAPLIAAAYLPNTSSPVPRAVPFAYVVRPRTPSQRSRTPQLPSPRSFTPALRSPGAAHNHHFGGLNSSMTSSVALPALRSPITPRTISPAPDERCDTSFTFASAAVATSFYTTTGGVSRTTTPSGFVFNSSADTTLPLRVLRPNNRRNGARVSLLLHTHHTLMADGGLSTGAHRKPSLTSCLSQTLLRTILKMLADSPRDFDAFAACNRSLHTMSFQLAEKLIVHDVVDDVQWESLLRYLCPLTRGQHVRQIRVRGDVLCTMPYLYRLLALVPHLVALDLRGITILDYEMRRDSFLVDLGAACPKLTTLCIEPTLLAGWCAASTSGGTVTGTATGGAKTTSASTTTTSTAGSSGGGGRWWKRTPGLTKLVVGGPYSVERSIVNAPPPPVSPPRQRLSVDGGVAEPNNGNTSMMNTTFSLYYGPTATTLPPMPDGFHELCLSQLVVLELWVPLRHADFVRLLGGALTSSLTTLTVHVGRHTHVPLELADVVPPPNQKGGPGTAGGGGPSSVAMSNDRASAQSGARRTLLDSSLATVTTPLASDAHLLTAGGSIVPADHNATLRHRNLTSLCCVYSPKWDEWPAVPMTSEGTVGESSSFSLPSPTTTRGRGGAGKEPVPPPKPTGPRAGFFGELFNFFKYQAMEFTVLSLPVQSLS